MSVGYRQKQASGIRRQAQGSRLKEQGTKGQGTRDKEPALGKWGQEHGDGEKRGKDKGKRRKEKGKGIKMLRGSEFRVSSQKFGSEVRGKKSKFRATIQLTNQETNGGTQVLRQIICDSC